MRHTSEKELHPQTVVRRGPWRRRCGLGDKGGRTREGGKTKERRAPEIRKKKTGGEEEREK